MLLSGPAAGVIGALETGRAAGFANVVTLDVGGTSADIGVIHEGRLRYKHWLDNEIAGFGLRLPMVDVSTIGAGGGSIAYVDSGGMLQVGPRSAGAEPGPACYGRGGKRATVTDAQVVLGRLREERFLGGRMAISRDLAIRAIAEQIADPLGLSVEAAAAGIIRVATSHMVEAIELNSVRRGYDPRDFALIAFGGAGPLFATDIARELEIPDVLVPRYPGILSAIGLLMTDVIHAQATSLVKVLNEAVQPLIQSALDRLEEKVAGELTNDGFARDEITITRFAECRYVGQGYEVRVAAPAGYVDSNWLKTLSAAFHAAHQKEYAHSFPDYDIEIVNVGVQGSGPLERIPTPELPRRAGPLRTDEARLVWIEELGRATELPIFQRSTLCASDTIHGPALVEQDDSTVIISGDRSGRVDSVGNMIISTLGTGRGARGARNERG
jgi:5-oxoprolinase (ATP-hydrolysing)/N-methylhydantoinase A